MSSDSRGWFADVDSANYGTPMDHMYQPCLDMGTGLIPCFEVWFQTREECEAFIRDEVIPIAARMADDA